MTEKQKDAERLLAHLRVQLDRANEDRQIAEHSARLILKKIQKLRREHKI